MEVWWKQRNNRARKGALPISTRAKNLYICKVRQFQFEARLTLPSWVFRS